MPTSKKGRWFLVAVGVVVLVLGFASLNYTKGFDFDHHKEWAGSNNLPEPTYPIYLLGVVMTVLGSGFIGFQLGRRPKK